MLKQHELEESFLSLFSFLFFFLAGICRMEFKIGSTVLVLESFNR